MMEASDYNLRTIGKNNSLLIILIMLRSFQEGIENGQEQRIRRERGFGEGHEAVLGAGLREDFHE
ncbi:hypothetical protein J25TS5_26190 [Paenibacillus faecis]|nr:hypothetical protein J25TS5_26190 [Paenibacillus faecis]